MMVRRYVVKEMPQALERIRRDMGKDAIILSTKKVRPRGFWGLFKKSQIEVVAAVGSPDKMRPESSGVETPAPAVPVPSTPVVESGGVPVSPRAATGAREPGEVQDLAAEVREMRQLMRKMLTGGFRSSTAMVHPAPALQGVHQMLLENDVDEGLADFLIDRLAASVQDPFAASEAQLKSKLRETIYELIRGCASAPLDPRTKVAAFVGPTGVGKTTTIAKLAAGQVLENGKKVALVTTDTYRIAAVEQLRTYANILNVPLEVVYSVDDIDRVLRSFEGFDLVLIDTAGRNYNQSANVSELVGYLNAIKPDETYLVLSLTTKSSDLERIVKCFEGVPIDKYLFTKLDETHTYGALLNLLHRHKRPLSYLTTGQNVPDDIEVVKADKLTRLIVGEGRYV
jgi:flagellar biosynthesis protein FlhF